MFSPMLASQVSLGGVDVGNSRVVQYNLPDFSSEIELNEFADELVPRLIDAVDPKVSRWIEDGSCNLSGVKYLNLEVQTYHKFIETSFSWSKKYTGIIYLELNHCRDQNRIIDDSRRDLGNY